MSQLPRNVIALPMTWTRAIAVAPGSFEGFLRGTGPS